MALPMFFEIKSNLSNADYSDTVKSVFGFTSKKIIIRWLAGTNPVYFSLNGTTDHGVVGTTLYPTEVVLEVSTNEVWFRNGSGTEDVTITALPRD